MVVGLGFIVTYEAAMLADPGERSLYYPPNSALLGWDELAAEGAEPEPGGEQVLQLPQDRV
ncbi:hypothetical protein ACIBBG_33585, partial [Micromonospora chersina]|uniref:hypothetical protein n=1 Tax=Micromonospora chersina TaxID=47854 RepID=UPI0037AA5FA5